MTDEPVPTKRGRGRPPGTAASSTTNRNPKTVKARMDEYERTMPKLTLNDLSLLQAMVFMEIELPKIQKKIAKMKDGREIKAANEAYTNMLKEYRQIQDSLGIGRSQRGNEIDMQREVDALVQESTELVEKYGRQIRCSECSSDFEMGTIIFHFLEDVAWEFRFICPKCGKSIKISGIKYFESNVVLLPERTLVIEGELSGAN